METKTAASAKKKVYKLYQAGLYRKGARTKKMLLPQRKKSRQENCVVQFQQI